MMKLIDSFKELVEYTSGKFEYYQIKHTRADDTITYGDLVTETKDKYGHIVVCAISSVYPAKLGKRELAIKSNHPDFKKTGLRIDSVVKIDRIATLRKSEIKVY